MKKSNLGLMVAVGCGILATVLLGLFGLVVRGMQGQRDAFDDVIAGGRDSIEMQARIDRLGVKGLKVAKILYTDADLPGMCADLTLPKGLTAEKARDQMRTKFKTGPRVDTFNVSKDEVFIVSRKGETLEACVAHTDRDVVALRADYIRRNYPLD